MIASTDQTFFLVDGRPQECIPASDRGLAYGDGLFETIRCKNGRAPAWPLHLQRIASGAEVLGLELDKAVLEAYLDSALSLAGQAQLSDIVIKMLVTRGDGGRGYLPPVTAKLRTILIIKPYQATLDVDVELKNCAYRLNHNPTLAGIKHLNRLEQVLTARSANLNAHQQGLVFDIDDRIIETLHHNLFLVKNGGLLTSELNLCGVAGVLRRAILEQFAPKLGLATSVADVYEQDLQTADEVFICNSVHGITPVRQWQDCVWSRGEITERLMQFISRQWNKMYDC